MNQVATDQQNGRIAVELRESGIPILRLGQVGERTVSLTFERLASLREAIAQLRKSRPSGLIITGPSNEMFTVGADINAIAGVTSAEVGERLAREGQAIFDEIATLPFPVVAAISGPCVGGGYELALACTYRILSSHPSSLVGLPEVKLGILPGFGGTQRLPRLVGLPLALDVILAGKTLRPDRALRAGLVNEVVPPERLLSRAEEAALGKGRKAVAIKLSDRLLTNTSIGRRLVKSSAGRKALAQSKGFYPAPLRALHCAVYGLDHGMEQGLAEEARELGRLIVSPESQSLVHLFKLSEAAKALGKGARKSVEQLHGIVVGAGVMGAGIAGALARAECTVTLRDTSDDALKRGLDHIKRTLERQRSLSEKERSFILNRIEASTKDAPNVGNAGVVIEAIFEDLKIKQKVLGELTALVPSDAIIASNTSSLSISELASGIDAPERVVGMHFFNPVEKMPLVEVVRGRKTSDITLLRVAALAVKLGKFPIVVEDVPGFLVNRVLAPYLAEAGTLLQEGHDPQTIDRAVLEFGMPMGPIRLLDEVGLDIVEHVASMMQQAYGDRMEGPGHATLLVKMGRKGRKSGAGFYDYKEGEAVPWSGLAAALNLPSGTQSDGEMIRDRVILRLVNEAVRCLDEGVAGTPGPEAAGQVDLGTVMGMGFPPFRGGVIRYAEQLGAEQLLSKLRSLEQRFGARFAPAPGIIQRAERRLSFYAALH